jgi:hypothetical protein
MVKHRNGPESTVIFATVIEVPELSRDQGKGRDWPEPDPK